MTADPGLRSSTPGHASCTTCPPPCRRRLSVIDTLDAAVSERRAWVEPWPEGAAFLTCLVAQDVQEAIAPAVGRWPRCRTNGDHTLHVEPDLGEDPTGSARTARPSSPRSASSDAGSRPTPGPIHARLRTMREPTEREARLLDAAVVTGGLGPRYSQPHREYHNLMHIEDVLLRIEELEPPAEHELALALAAWFHDAVYQPGKDDNEDRSAYVAYDALEQVGASPELIAEVVRLVAAHRAPRPRRRRRRRCGAVRRRPGDPRRRTRPLRASTPPPSGRSTSTCPEADFRTGRAAVLRRFLDRPTIYRTAYGREHWEDAARANIAAEIEVLESGGG